ncbi:MAG: aminoglycoside phosphotransferase family protein [Formosimonas sp.]
MNMNLPNDARVQLLTDWLRGLPADLNLAVDQLSVASADASFRRYFRVPAGASHLIVMDAPPTHEDCRPFIHVTQLFGAAVNVPKIIAQDLDLGFLLLSDLGNTTYLSAMQADLGCANALYRDALTALVQLQKASTPSDLPPYDRDRLLNEMLLFPQWYVGVHKKASLTDAQTAQLTQVFNVLLDNNLAQAQVWVHRDYHSRNLMVMEHNNPGILDFQDALYGPITYDLASLLRDAYIEWDEAQQIDWLVRYWEAARSAGLNVPAAFDVFYKDFEWMGLQRHLKVLGIFARLYHRDGKAGYLKDIPLVLKYTRQVAARYREFAPLVHLLNALDEETTPQVGYTF